MTKLNDHFIAMQGMAARFILPNDQPYVDRDGNRDDAGGKGLQQPQRNFLFANDMLYMLDGPEQREAQKAQAADLEAEAADWRADLRKQIEQADHIANNMRDHAKAMERRNLELVKELEATKEQLHMEQMRLSEREGRLAMLERLGTIPEAKPQDFNNMGLPMRPTYGVR